MYFTFDKNQRRTVIQLQHQLDLAFGWFHHWRIKINSTKTTAVLFGRTYTNNPPPLRINNYSIYWSKQAKHTSA